MIIRFCIVLQLYALVASQKTELDSPDNLRIYREFRNWFFQQFGSNGQSRKFSTDYNQRTQEEIPPNVPFPCNVTGGRSSKVPNSVHRLRPGDIDVVAAIGDSLTAGAGLFATNVFQVGIENRGAVASIGGQGTWRTCLTLPNILKEFNPNLIGYSYGDSLTSHPASQLNVAEIGAMSKDMPFMAKYLINRIRKDSRINIKKHWKLVSIFIGCNDFCSDMCELPSPQSILEAHKIDLINTLRILRDNLPRTLVIIILPPHLKEFVVSREGRPSLGCYLTTNLECPCLISLQFRDRRQEFFDIIKRWQELEEKIGNYPEFNKKDFTVVISPALKYSEIPKLEDGFTDTSYLSSDCFHVSQKANAIYANSLWNNLLEPVNNKSESWLPVLQKFLCPTPERPFLMTRENSWMKNEIL